MAQSFGAYIRKVRIEKAELTLRDAAEKIGIAPPYLSRIEAGLERPPSSKVLLSMAKEYSITEDEILSHAQHRAAEVYANKMVDNRALKALFKATRNLDESDLIAIIRKVCQDHGLDEAKILDEINGHRRDRTQLPRLERLINADLVPRILSKVGISRMADQFLAKHGLRPGTYSAPTYIERLVDLESGIQMFVDEQLTGQADGEPRALGVAHWSHRQEGIREIHINHQLATRRSTDTHRLRFTVGHELFHCLEHLPLMDDRARLADALHRTFTMELDIPVQANPHQVTHGKRSLLECWIEKSNGPRRLTTNVDWREWQADYFSACVLMPDWSVREQFIERLGRQEIVVGTAAELRRAATQVATERIFEHKVFEKPLYELYDVSVMAMSIRLMDLKLVHI